MARAPAPRFGNEATSPFLRTLQSHGFKNWFIFNHVQDSLALPKAIAAGLLMHSSREYPDVDTFLKKDWRPKIQSILDILQQTREEDRYSSLDFWEQLGGRFSEVIQMHFISADKSEQAKIIASGKILSPDNKTAYKSLAEHFRMCLTWYQCNDGKVLTRPFHDISRGQTSLFVNVAQEGDFLYLLYHENTYENPRIGFPFFMKIDHEGEALIIDEQLPAVEQDPREALINALAGLVQAQSELLEELQEVASQAVLDALQEKKNAIEGLFKSVPAIAVSLPFQRLERILALPVRVESQVVHTVATCEQFPSDSDYLDFHGHKIHRSCMQNYLSTFLPVNSAQLPNCPLCQLSIPDNVIDVHPTYRQCLQEYIRALSGSQPYLTGHLTNAVTSDTYSAAIQVLCSYCQTETTAATLSRHGCQLCLSCIYSNFYSQRQYCNCNQFYTDEEISIFEQWWQKQ